MSIYSVNDTGTKQFRSRFTKSISYNMQYDCRFGDLIPVCRKFVLPGDVWRIAGDALIRLQPMLTPPMNKMTFRVRYFFVPLRLLDSNTELILTGSNNGHLFEPDEDHPYPVFPNVFANGDKTKHTHAFEITKHSLYDYFGCQVGNYESFKDDECLPAEYWGAAYYRILYDFYFDENLSTPHRSYDTFEDYWKVTRLLGGDLKPYSCNIPKDYFTSALPWQLKAPAAPVLNVTGTASFTPDFDLTKFVYDSTESVTPPWATEARFQTDLSSKEIFQTDAGETGLVNVMNKLDSFFNNEQEVLITGLGFTAADERAMFAQTRIFERLARCGSRYTEFLHANFGIAPADESLQRPQYLGGWKMPIITTEVVQTAADSNNPVGTLRGHGISRGGNRIKTFIAKEFGIIIGLGSVLPEIKYTTGVPREMSYKKRFDFFNPSFQHLSEQEVRNGELYIGSDGLNDDTFGFQAYANELRSSQNIVVGDMRDSLSNWNQAISFSSRPNLNNAFISSATYRSNFNQCFSVSGSSAYPIVVDFQNIFDVYRPMVKYATPGLVDHL